MRIHTKRIYDAPSAADGVRILCDRLWPRAVTREAAAIDFWAKEVAPSNELRRWYQHDPEKWPEFRSRYFVELDANPQGVEALLSHLKDGPVTLLYSSKEQDRNNATALREYLEGMQSK